MGLQDFTVYDIFSRNTRIFASREALVGSSSRLNFNYLLYYINMLSFLLAKFGLRKGDRIAVLSQNCSEFFLLYGAAARLGAVPKAPTDRSPGKK
jgi:acyl-CoA synthetase (AMP-forming)/AMP-acid ligase II